MAVRVAVSRHTPRRFPARSRTRRAAELPRGSGAAGRGQPGTAADSRLRGPGAWHRGSPQPVGERASALHGGVSLLFFFFAVLKSRGASPSPWLGGHETSCHPFPGR